MYQIRKSIRRAIATLLLVQVFFGQILLPFHVLAGETIPKQQSIGSQEVLIWNTEANSFVISSQGEHNELSFELLYNRALMHYEDLSDTVEITEGIMGTIGIDEDSKTVQAATCSSGVCTNHEVHDGSLKIYETENEENVMYEAAFVVSNGVLSQEVSIDNLRLEKDTVSPSPTPTITENTNGSRPDQILNPSSVSYGDYVSKNQILVKLKNDVNPTKRAIAQVSKVQALAHENDVEIIDTIDSTSTIVVEIDEEKTTIEEAIETLESEPEVEVAEPVYVRETLGDNTPIGSNDTSKNNLWGLYNSGQVVNGKAGTTDADIDAPAAWPLSEGNNVIVAVIDTGVSYNHADLQANMWNGSSCVNENNVTIPGGCLHGYDYEHNDNNPLPTSELHGTHVAGTIAAIKNNGVGIAGVAPKVKIMAIKTSFTTDELIKAIRFAKNNGAHVINASYGGYGYSSLEQAAIAEFTNAGGVFVAAAGNDSTTFPMYPASYNNSNIISVAATDQNDALTWFSNYGSNVDIAAPGENIYSTSPQVTTTEYIQDFESVTPPNIPSDWTKSGTFGTFYFDAADNTVLYGDTAYPYRPNNSSYAKSQINMSGAHEADISFVTSCDTEYSLSTYTDFMSLQVSKDGTNFDTLLEWDEVVVDIWNEDDLDSTGAAGIAITDFPIDTSYLTSQFAIRFVWRTDSYGYGGGDGCLIDDILVRKVSMNNSVSAYTYLDGTSMAAPHVSGVAALVKSYRSDLSNNEIIQAIYASGDAKSSLAGKVNTGKRLNAYKALELVTKPANTAPDAVNDSFSTPEDTALTINFSSLLSNDSDMNAGDTVSFVAAQNAVNGSISTNSSAKTVTFTPTANFNGTASFTYTIRDAEGLTDTATVSITITAVNDAPVLDPVGNKSVNENETLSFVLSGSDIDNVPAFSATGLPANASFNSSTKTFNFTPNETQGGNNYEVTFTISDGSLSDQETITITVNEVNNPPGAVNDTFVTNEDTSITITDEELLNNDSDVDNLKSELSISNFNSAQNGSLTLNLNGSVTFTPAANFFGTAGFTYTVEDPEGLTDTGSVMITVNGVNDAPVLDTIGSKTVDEYEALSFVVTAFDVDNDALTITTGSIPTNAMWNNQTNTFSFTPDETQGGQNFVVSFNVSDGSVLDTEHVTIAVREVNNKPTAADDSGTTNEDTSMTFTEAALLTNDSDVDNSSAELSIANVGSAIHGSVVLNPNKTVTFTPTADYNGDASFIYTVSDPDGLSDTATVYITINAVNDAPTIALLPNVLVDEYETISVTATGNDIDGDIITFSIDVTPTNAVFDPTSGKLTFTPDETQGGQIYTLTITATDGEFTAATTFTINVNEVNNNPSAVDDTATTDEDVSVTISHADLLSNDSDVDNSPEELRIIAVHSATHGSVTMDQNSVVFTPEADYNGPATFSYTVQDPGELSDTATVTVNISSVNDAPIITQMNNKIIDEYETLNIQIEASDIDGDVLTFSSVTLPFNAQIDSTGSLTFTPDETQGGQTFDIEVTAQDAELSDSMTFTISVNEVNNAPDAIDDSITTDEDVSVSISGQTLISNDTDPDNTSGELSIESVSNPTHGSVTLNLDGSVIFAPAANYSGTGSFSYTVQDPGALTDSATVSVTIDAVNDAPSIADQQITTRKNKPVTVQLGEVTDIDGDPVTYTVSTEPQHGEASIIGNNLTFTPDTDYVGTDVIEVQATDPSEESDTATIEVTISANNAPVGAPLVLQTEINKSVSVTLIGTDADEDALGFEIVKLPTHGTVWGSGNKYTYTPAADFKGNDLFQYTVSDGDETSGPYDVTITVIEPVKTNPGSPSTAGSNGKSETSCSATVPQAVPFVAVESVTSTQVTLVWAPSVGPVTHYSVLYSDQFGNNYGVSDVGEGKRFTVSSLMPNTTYTFTVKAHNHCASSPLSTAIKAQTKSGNNVMYYEVVLLDEIYSDDEASVSAKITKEENEETEKDQHIIEAEKDSEQPNYGLYIILIVIIGIGGFIFLTRRGQKV